jgi:hypothetical protein
VALDPVAVALKFGFLAILYLFLLWMARSALKDLRSGGTAQAAYADDATGMHVAGSAYSLADGAVLGRGEQADIRLEDTFASSQHARLAPHGEVIVLEDLGSTNGTYLNEEPLRGPQPLHPGDRIRIGDSQFTFER